MGTPHPYCRYSYLAYYIVNLHRTFVQLFIIIALSHFQEGSRYNALHVAAKSKNAAITDLILQTVGDPAFVRLLYGDDSLSVGTLGTAAERSAVLLDLYLNTPDKGMHETPLHFATKFGAAQVVSTLVSYAECDRESINKFGQRPIDVSGKQTKSV